MGALFDTVRENVSAKEAAEYYGLHMNRHGKAICPWHDDHHPSLSFREQRCKCFACNHGGSSIDLTAKLLDLSPLEAAKRINTDFHLAQDTTSQKPIGPSHWELRKKYEMWMQQQYKSLCLIRTVSKTIVDSFIEDDAKNSSEFHEALQAYAQVLEEIEQLELLTFEDYLEA